MLPHSQTNWTELVEVRTAVPREGPVGRLVRSVLEKPTCIKLLCSLAMGMICQSRDPPLSGVCRRIADVHLALASQELQNTTAKSPLNEKVNYFILFKDLRLLSHIHIGSFCFCRPCERIPGQFSMFVASKSTQAVFWMMSRTQAGRHRG